MQNNTQQVEGNSYLPFLVIQGQEMDHLQILKRLKGIRVFTQRKFTLWDR